MVAIVVDTKTVEIRCNDCGKVLEEVSVDDAFNCGCGYAQCYKCSVEKVE